MPKLVFLDGAKEDFFEIKLNFGRNVTEEQFKQFKKSFKDIFVEIKTYPDAGALVAEASALGMDVRQRLAENVRVVYSVDKTQNIIYIRMFLHTSRDFITHLEKRLLRL